MKGLLAKIMFACALLGAAANVFSATLTTRLDRPVISLGESAHVQLRFENGNPQVQPMFPNQPNLAIQLSGQSVERYAGNARMTSALVLTYTVTPAQVGNYTIPAILISVDGTTLSTEPVKLQVKEASNEAAPAIAFLRLQASKTNVYVGEVLPIEIKIYAPIIDDVPSLNLKSDGFTIGAQGQSMSTREQVGNQIYNVVTLPMTVSPAKAGKIPLGPAEAQAVIRTQTQGRRRTVDLFEEMLGGMQRQKVALKSEPVAINVMPLPSENVPPSFNGAVGNYQITVKASPTNVSVGDPISMQVQVKGRGAFDTVKLPDFGWKDFSFYPPNSSVTNLDALGINAVKYFDEVVVPQRAGIAAIPAFVFSFFDPEKRAYQTIERPPIPINVKATGHGQAQPTVIADPGAPAENQRPATDIVHIKPTLGHLTFLGPPPATRAWFLWLQLLPIGLWGAAVAWRRQAEKLANDPRLRRQREVAKHIAETLPRLREHAVKNETELFFATAFRLLQEQLGERLDVPAAAITEAVIDDKLPELGASKELLASLSELFQASNQARYAGITVAGMEALIPKVEAALRDIQKLSPAPGGSK